MQLMICYLVESFPRWRNGRAFAAPAADRSSIRSQDRPITFVKTGSDSSIAKCSATSVSVTGP